eukprot:1357975-Amorphochlora_amoeboformis.AAC.3
MFGPYIEFSYLDPSNALNQGGYELQDAAVRAIVRTISTSEPEISFHMCVLRNAIGTETRTKHAKRTQKENVAEHWQGHSSL